MNKKFTEYKQLHLTETAQQILNHWKDHEIFEKSMSSREGNPSFVFYDGPPSANGKPGIHHVISRTIKDIFCRYQTLKGKQVKRKAGWDTHGLPIELGVEKALGITKEDIGTKISIADYNKACRESVMRYTDEWIDLTEKMGYWVDLEDPYITYDSKYMETLWYLLKEIYTKGWLYKGYAIQPYSPAAGTGLSSHELNLPGTYKDVTDTTIVAQFKTKKDSLPPLFDDIEAPIYLLAWTTTPWTLPSNTALTVGAHIDYALVRTFNQYTFEFIVVILANNLITKQLAGKYFETESEEDFIQYKAADKKIPFQLIKHCKGSDLVGIHYEQLLPWAVPYLDEAKAFCVIDGHFVTTEDGTGIVHTAPTFGADDAAVAKKHGVPPLLVLDAHGEPIPLVDMQGRFVKQLNNIFAGKFVKNEYYKENPPKKSVDVEIAILLKIENKAFKVEKYIHSYPHCWRTDKPILYYPLDSWFIKTTAVKERMIALNQKINWKPESTGKGRFGNWLENVNDWNLSRSRYWGVPLPIWRTAEGDEEIVVGSIEELYAEIEKSVAAGLMSENPYKDFATGDMSKANYDKVDLHKHLVDAIILLSPKEKPMKREADLIDVWFDSGAMPYAQLHYPFENKEQIENHTNFPADFIAEGVDQTRGWFYTLHAISAMIKGEVAYRNVISNGLVLDKNGQKMSKSKGNGVDPFEILTTYGADATRWYMIANAQPWENLKFDRNGIDEVRRKFFGTLYNTYSFFALYANLDHFSYGDEIPLEERTELDRWILSELHSLIQEIDLLYTSYEPTRAARRITQFVTDNLSNWYVRLNRRRFWKGDYTEDKRAAYQTLYTCLLTIAKISSPIAPFFMDQLYRDLTCESEEESVHIATFPIVNAAYIDTELEEKIQLAQKITSMVLSLRKKEQIKVRQPLQKMMIPVFDQTLERHLNTVSDMIKQEVNVKELHLLSDEASRGLLTKQIKPDFKALGPKFGSSMKEIAQKVANFTQNDILTLEKEGTIMMEVEGKNIALSVDDVQISSKDIEGWLVTSEHGLTVALDIQIDETLASEGIARELINRIQNLRKNSNFEVNDHIAVKLLTHPKIANALSLYEPYIKEEVLADTIELIDNLKNGTEIDFDDISSQIVITKV